MAEILGKKHRSLQIKEKPSKTGTLTGLLMKLFNWNGWFMRKGVPKKLPSAEGYQDSKLCSKDERLPMPRLITIPDEEIVSFPAISQTCDPHNAMESAPAEDGIQLQKAGVVARLMGLDYIPCSHSKGRDMDSHQVMPILPMAGKGQQPKDINMDTESFENSSQMVKLNKQHLQKQMTRSLEINLKRMSKISFLNYASEQKEDPQKISVSNQTSPHYAAPINSKSRNKFRSSKTQTESKRARLLLEAAVKTLEPNCQASNHDRPALVQALASRKVHQKTSDRNAPDKRICHREFEEAASKASGKLSKARHKIIQMVASETHLSSSQSETTNISEQYQHKHEDNELSPQLNHSSVEIDLANQQNTLQTFEIEKTSTSSRSGRPARDLKSGKIHNETLILNPKEVGAKDKETLNLNEKEVGSKGARYASQEKAPTKQKALTDFSLRRNHNESTKNHKSQLNASLGKTLSKSHSMTLSFRGTEQAGVTLASSLSQNIPSQMYKQAEDKQGSNMGIDNPDPMELKKSSEEPIVNESPMQLLPIKAIIFNGEQHADGKYSANRLDLLGPSEVIKHCEAEPLEKNTDESPTNNHNTTRIEVHKLTHVHRARHPDGDVPNQKDDALQDDNLEDILKGELPMTISPDSLNENGYEKCIGSLQEEYSEVCSQNLEGQDQIPLDEHRNITIPWETESAPTPPESTSCRTSISNETECKPDNVEDGGQPSPVSVLDGTFEDEDDVRLWSGEAFTEKAMLGPAAALAGGNEKFLNTCKKNLFTRSESRNREIVIQEAVLYNLKWYFRDNMLKAEGLAEIYVDYGCKQDEVDDLLLQKRRENTFGSIEKMQYQSCMHQFTPAENTCPSSNEGYSCKLSTASGFHDKLLSDCAKEVLWPKLSKVRCEDIWFEPLFVELTTIGRHIVHQACKQIVTWSQINLSTIIDLVDSDLSIPAENWTDFQREEVEIAANIENIIFSIILYEIANDLLVSTRKKPKIGF